jgi:AAA15 family ATPase/GTPase
MLAEFTVENYKSIKKKQTLSFIATSDKTLSEYYIHKVKEDVNLLKIAIIYGSNASGKSNLLDALNFFRWFTLHKPSGRDQKIDVVPFLLDNTSKKSKTKMSLSFYIGTEEYILNYEFDTNRIYSENLIVYTSVQPTLLYKRQYDEATDSSFVEFGNRLDLSSEDKKTIIGNTLNNRTVIAAFSMSNVAKSRLNDVYDYFTVNFAQELTPRLSMIEYVKENLEKDHTGNLKKFIDKLLKASDFNISDIKLRKLEQPITPEISKIIQSNPIPEDVKNEMLKKGSISYEDISFVHKIGDKTFELPEDYESDGTIRYMGLAVMLNFLLNENHVVIVDEIESSLHYELLSYFIKTFLANSQKASQLIMTTHNLNLLDEDYIRQDTIWFTDKDESGQTKLKRLSSLHLRKTLSPYNAYLQGKLVPTPFTESPFIDLAND